MRSISLTKKILKLMKILKGDLVEQLPKKIEMRFQEIFKQLIH